MLKYNITGYCQKNTDTNPIILESVIHLSFWSIYIYNSPLGPSNGFVPRFLGFSLFVSNTTNKSEGVLCFKDTSYTLNTIPAVFNTTCLVHGQYVIYYNERLPGVIYPDEYSQYAHNELCEVEVFGTFFFLLCSWKLCIFLKSKRKY